MLAVELLSGPRGLQDRTHCSTETAAVQPASKQSTGSGWPRAFEKRRAPTRSELTRLVIIAGVLAAIAAVGLIAGEAAGPRERPNPSREAGWDRDRRPASKVCIPLAESPELILLVHNARGRYCMW